MQGHMIPPFAVCTHRDVRCCLQDVLQQGTLVDLENGQKLLEEYAASLEAESAARERSIQFLRTMLQQQVASDPLYKESMKAMLSCYDC